EGLCAFDIHWRIANPQVFAAAVGYDELASRSRPVPALGPHARTLCPVDALVLACIHRVAHHGDSDDLFWLWDVHLLASALSPEDVDLLVDVASRSAMRAVCAHTLQAAFDRFATPHAEELIDRVKPPPGHEEESASFLAGGLRQVDIL